MQPRENRTIALLDGFQQTRRSDSQVVAACGQWPIGRVYTLLPARNLRTDVQSTRPCYQRHYPTLIWSQSSATTPPLPKGSPATFNFARFQTSKTSYLETHTVLDAAGSSIPGCGDPGAAFRHHLVAIVFSIPHSSIASIPYSRSTLLYLPPPATPSTSLIFLILNHDHGHLYIQVVSFALSFLATEVLRREASPILRTKKKKIPGTPRINGYDFTRPRDQKQRR